MALFTPAAQSRAGEKWAVLVGVGQYEDTSINPLPYAPGDAKAFRDLLVERGGFAEDHIALLVDGGDKDLLPTRRNILRKLSWWLKLKAVPGDTVIFYFSGHGIGDQDTGHLVPIDAHLYALADESVSLGRVRDYLRESGADVVFLVLDACHSGYAEVGAPEGKMSEGFGKTLVIEEPEGARSAKGWAALTSCAEGEYSYPLDTTKPFSADNRSAFTNFFLEGLSGPADTSPQDGVITVRELNEYVHQKVTQWALSAGVSQEPQVKMSGSGAVTELRLLSTAPVAPPAPTSPHGTPPSLPVVAPPPPAASAKGKIAFASDRDGNFEVYVMNSDGSNQTRLTNNPYGDTNPTWSPDGRKIAFGSLRDLKSQIYVMNSDGTNQTRLTNDPYGGLTCPCWSPDGSKIAFHWFRDFSPEIWVMDSDGTKQTLLTNKRSWHGYPSWSPDGSKIASAAYDGFNSEIYVMNSDGTNPTGLTNTPEDDHEPSWSPDGMKIAFLSYRDGNWEIYVMNPDGTNQTRLTNNPADDSYPSWSPDGSKIAFASNRDGNWEIYVMNADGSNQTNLTNNPARDGEPSWSPF